MTRLSVLLLGVLGAVAGFLVAANWSTITGSLFDACVRPAGHADSAWIPGGTYMMGSDEDYPDEAPVSATVAGFYIDRHEVTNAQFGQFVAATSYLTVAERPLDPMNFPDLPRELLEPGSAVFSAPSPGSEILQDSQWWRYVAGASWRAPHGPGSNLDGLHNHPVVHIAFEDALTYAQWADRDLPTEAEWERAARGGLAGKRFAWGDRLRPGSRWLANTWQGTFPLNNSVEDGFRDTAPVGCFPANGYGMYDMIGNAWEWVGDWYFPTRIDARRLGDDAGGYDPNQPGVPVRVLKGGSFLCADNFCSRYRPAARYPQDTTLGASNIGFRTVKRPL